MRSKSIESPKDTVHNPFTGKYCRATFASAMASRTVTRSAIPITNPNSKPSTDMNGAKDDEGAPLDTSPSSQSATSANHPSSTVAPIMEAPRPTAIRPPQNTWNSLDMGGVNIKNLPPRLVSFHSPSLSTSTSIIMLSPQCLVRSASFGILRFWIFQG